MVILLKRVKVFLFHWDFQGRGITFAGKTFNDCSLKYSKGSLRRDFC